MKVISALLIFLVTSTLRKEEACKTSRHNAGPGAKNIAVHTDKQQQTSDRDDGTTKNKKSCTSLRNLEPNNHLAIAGGGPMAAIILARLSNSTLPKGTQITVVEFKKEIFKFGTGLPYDPSIAKSAHLMNAFQLHTVSVTGEERDIIDWTEQDQVLEHSEIVKDYYDALENSEVPTPPQRIIFGRYLQKRFHHFKEQCEEKDYTVKLMPETRARNISAHPSGCGYLITLDKGDPIHTQNIFLATGHFSASRFSEDPLGYQKSPWPARTLLRNVKEDDNIGILGDGGSQSIDAVLTFAHEYGTFADNDREYTPKLNRKNFKVTLYSRGGHLPTIERHHPIHKPKHMTEKNIEAEINEKNVRPLDAIFRFLKKDIIDLLPPIPEKETFYAMPVKEFFENVEKELKNDPRTVFAKDMENTPNKQLLKLHSLFDHAAQIFVEYLQNFSAEQYVVYKKYIEPRIREAQTRLPMVNAVKMNALIEAGCLVLEAIGEDYNISKREGGSEGVTLTKENHEPVHHRYFVDAMEQEGYIRKDPRQLTQSLLDNGLAMPNAFRFEFPNYASFILHKELKRDGFDKSRIVEIKEKETYDYEGDGVVMDVETMRVIPRPGVSTSGFIYAGAPFTFGYFPNVQSLLMAVQVADTAVRDMETQWQISQRLAAMYPPVVPGLYKSAN